MLKEEEINQLAKKYANQVANEYDIPERIQKMIETAYIVGAKQSDDAHKIIWHEANEEPTSKMKPLLILTNVENEYYRYTIINVWIDWENSVKMHAIARWAYIEDLLSKN